MSNNLVPQGKTYFKPNSLVQTGVLGQLGTVLATHGDVVLANGVMTFSTGMTLTLDSITGWAITDYTLGQAQVSYLDLTGISVNDSTLYKLTFMMQNTDVIPQGIFTSTITSGIGATAGSIVAQFAQQINNNINAPITAVAVGNILIITEVSYTTGGFLMTYPTGGLFGNVVYQTTGTVSGTAPAVGDTLSQATSGATGTVVSIPSTGVIGVYVTVGGAAFDTSHTVTDSPGAGTWTPSANVTQSNVQSSGGQYQVSVLTSIQPPLTTGQYRLYAFQYNNPSPNSMLGSQAISPALAYMWINELATNFAALDTYIKGILAGTETAALYLGVPA